MSYEAVAEARRFSRAKNSAFSVLVALAEHADQHSREAWPAVSTLATATRLDERTVQRALRHLEALREIEIVVAGGGKRRPTRYRVVPQNGATQQTLDGFTEPPKRRQVAALSGRRNGGNPSGDTPANDACNGDRDATQTVRKRQGTEQAPKPPQAGASAEGVWDQVIERLEGELDAVAFRQWIAPLGPARLDGDRLLVEAPDTAATWIRERYVGLLAKTATAVAGRPLRVEVPETAGERAERQKRERNAERQQRRAARTASA